MGAWLRQREASTPHSHTVQYFLWENLMMTWWWLRPLYPYLLGKIFLCQKTAPTAGGESNQAGAGGAVCSMFP